jgi:hypothetical protein
MSDTYVEFTRKKIAAHRAEELKHKSAADALEANLNDFLQSNPPAPPLIPAQMTPITMVGPNGLAAKGEPPVSRIAMLMEKIKESPNGYTTDDLIRIAEEAGNPVPRTTLRSQLWEKKTKGKLVKRRGKWFYKAEEPNAQTSGSSH